MDRPKIVNRLTFSLLLSIREQRRRERKGDFAERQSPGAELYDCRVNYGMQ